MKRPNREWGDFIPSGGINDSIAAWHNAAPERIQTCASPSTLMECPRVIWLKKHNVPRTNVMGWGKKQRLMLGRKTEDLIAEQLKEDGKLLWAWTDNYVGQSKKFAHGEGLDRLEGTPDLLIRLGETVAISDSKTARSDSYQWLPTTQPAVWDDPYWYKYKLQLVAYFMLSHWNKDWFEQRNLPLPQVCHLFSYSLDDGIVRREFSWTPSRQDAARVNQLVRRWNAAYASEEMPACTCVEDNLVKFCAYGVREEGAKVCASCCNELLGKEQV